MVVYNCITCNFTTSNKTDYSRHEKSQKHQKRIKENEEKCRTTEKHAKHIPLHTENNNKSKKDKQFKCDWCNNYFSRLDSLSRHKKTCTDKKLKEKDKDHQIELLKKEVEQKDFLIKELEKKEKDIEYYKDTLSAAGNMVQKSFSALTDIMNTYHNAPPIDCIKYVNFKTIKNYSDDDDMVIDILRSHNNNGLAEYIGKSILDIYKKDSPNDQSVWTTDTSRLTYVLKKFIDEDDSRWVVDKKGIETQKIIIDPLIKKISELTTKYYEDNAKNVNLAEMSRKEMEKVIEISEKYQSFMTDVRTGKLHLEILKFMAPHLSYKKKKQLELCDE